MEDRRRSPETLCRSEPLARRLTESFPLQITRTGQPIKVLEECVRKCQEDRTSVVTQCLSLDFMPGRLKSATGSSPPVFDDSACYLYVDQSQPDGDESLIEQTNAWHFNEVCLTCERKPISSFYVQTYLSCSCQLELFELEKLLTKLCSES